MQCEYCKSDRIVEICGKCSDLFNLTYKGENYEGYVPDDIGIGGGDYIQFKYCLECGHIHGNEFPAKDPILHLCCECGDEEGIHEIKSRSRSDYYCQSCYDELDPEDYEPDVTEEDMDFVNKPLNMGEFNENDDFWND